jgi:protease PrsW
MMNAAPAAAVRTRAARPWLRILLVGLGLWLATVVVTFLTGNPNLIPTLVLLGSFLVPVTFVAWAFERRDTGEITAGLIFNTFITGASSASWPPRCWRPTWCTRRGGCSSAWG